MKELIEQRIREAVDRLRIDEEIRGKFAKHTNQTEWNFGHHLAVILSGLFPLHVCEIEVSKVSLARGRPDIIIHRRGRHDFNCVVIEMKRNGNEQDTNEDRKQIQDHWFKGPYFYKFGVILNLCHRDNKINPDCPIEVLENANLRANGCCLYFL
jgi:hypothetical protein